MNRSPERPVAGGEVTAPEPGSETRLPSSQEETSPDDGLGGVNEAPAREQDETSAGTDFFASLIAFFGAVRFSKRELSDRGGTSRTDSLPVNANSG